MDHEHRLVRKSALTCFRTSTTSPLRWRGHRLFIRSTNEIPHAFTGAHPKSFGDPIKNLALRLIESQDEVRRPRPFWSKAYFHPDGLTDGSTFVNVHPGKGRLFRPPFRNLDKPMMPALPTSFCWSRFGTEAGETVDRILSRKERERSRNHGVFLWGIGSAIGPSIRELLRVQPEPEVIFSPIASKPRAVDVAPAMTVAWTAASDLDGQSVSLPRWSKVTSRAPSTSQRARHYALVCYSDAPLQLDPSPSFLRMDQLANLRSSAKVGASQVTAVVSYNGKRSGNGLAYAIALRVRLVEPYFVALAQPIVDGVGLSRHVS